MATLIPSIIFGLLGLFIILYGLKLLLGNLVGTFDLPLLLERRKLHRKQERLFTARRRIEEKNYAAALPLLRDAFLLEHLKHDVRLIERVNDHHLTVLQELISLARICSMRLSNLPLIEELLLTRTAAMKSYSETRVAARALSKRRARSQRPPAWAVNEFSKKLADLKERVDTTTRSLRTELDKLFRNASGSDARQVVCH